MIMRNIRLQRILMLILVSAVLFIAFFHLTRDIRDNDFFWHLKTGQWTWEHLEIPVKDPFSFTTQGLQSVREHVIMSSAWLSQVLYWLFAGAAGMPGIVLLRFITAGLFLLVMIKREEGDRVLYTGLLLLFLCLLLKSYPVERPQVFSFLLFALLLRLLKRGKEPGAPERARGIYGRSLYVTLPVLMLVWANMHAGYIAGVATIVLFIVCEGLKFASPGLRPLEKSDYKILAFAGFLGVLFSFMNPNTWRVFSENILFQYDYITQNNIEFQSTVRIFRRFHDYSVVVYWLVLSLTASGLLINRKKTDITEAALLAATGYFSFTSVRYVAFFLIAALPAVGRMFSEGKLLKPVRALIITVSLCTAVFFTRDHMSFKTLLSGRWIDEHKFPVEAAGFILSNDLTGNMYNYFNWGGYLIWRLAPGKKVFIDGRTLYSHTYLQSELIDNADERRLGEVPAWKAALEENNIQYTITPASLPLVRALCEDKNWVPVFYRYNSVIFVRDTPNNRNVIDKYFIDKDSRVCKGPGKSEPDGGDEDRN